LQRLLHLGRESLPEGKILMESDPGHNAKLALWPKLASNLHAIYLTVCSAYE
jgi:hypothetical protein